MATLLDVPRVAALPPQVSLQGVFACGPDGHQLLISPCGEAVRVNLAKGAPVRS